MTGTDKTNSPNITNNDIDDGGLITKIWGPGAWIFLHSITFCYPNEPTEEHKTVYKRFFKLLGYVLPCQYCKDYKKIIKTGITELNDDVLKNRESLTKWLYYVHDAINKKLEVEYGISYDDVVKRFESYRASCGMNDHNKGCEVGAKDIGSSFQIANIKDCSIIPIKLAKHFIDYAKQRKVGKEHFTIINLYLYLEKEIDKDTDEWRTRNKECCQIISKMREESIPSIEAEGKWSGLPTTSELKLILRLTSNLSKEKLADIIKNLPNSKCEYKKIYKLVN
jgi:Erv1 / Alr family